MVSRAMVVDHQNLLKNDLKDNIEKQNTMKELTKRERQIMEIVWELNQGFIKDILDNFPEPRPHYNTVATLVKILVKKGVLKSQKIGNTDLYSPTQDFEEYREQHLGDIKKKFFDNSFPKMLAHFAKKESMTEEEKEELIRIITAKKS